MKGAKQSICISLALLCLLSGIILPGRNQSTFAENIKRPTSQPAAVENASSPVAFRNRINPPLSFEANRGQAAPGVKFLSRSGGCSVLLSPREAVMNLQSAQAESHDSGAVALKMRLAGANPEAVMKGRDELPGKSNYLMGRDRKRWRTNISNYSQVISEQIYSGIDLLYYGNGPELEYDFIVAPGASSRAITLEFEGAQKIYIAANGDLALVTRSGEVRHKKPFVYQVIDGANPETKLMSKKAGKKIKRGRTTRIQVKNPDGSMSEEFRFTRQ